MRKVFLICLILFSYGSIAQDSVEVKNKVIFGTYEGYGEQPQEEVRFRLTVVNNTDHGIPDLGPLYRYKYVHFYINGEIDDPLSLFNGIDVVKEEYLISAGEKGIFEHAWVLSADSGIVQKYGNEFTVQWEYNGIRSAVMLVNLKSRTSRKVE